jgi:cell division protein FtsI/penicillin-binding protein 2
VWPRFSQGGTAVLLRVKDRSMAFVQNADAARRWVLPPGSTMKPFSLLALMERGKLTDLDEFVCPQKLILKGRKLACSHPVGLPPMNVSRAIAYSCNCALAHWALRFAPGELDAALLRAGFGPPLGDVQRKLTGADCQLQAIGAEGVEVTPLQMVQAYRRLALRSAEPSFQPILDGLEGAVEYGTAQRAQLNRIRVAGKTGTTLGNNGAHAGCFAGFAPSRSPEVAVVVLVQGRSGGGDAAPIAGQLLRTYFGERA